MAAAPAAPHPGGVIGPETWRGIKGATLPGAAMQRETPQMRQQIQQWRTVQERRQREAPAVATPAPGVRPGVQAPAPPTARGGEVMPAPGRRPAVERAPVAPGVERARPRELTPTAPGGRARPSVEEIRPPARPPVGEFRAPATGPRRALGQVQPTRPTIRPKEMPRRALEEMRPMRQPTREFRATPAPRQFRAPTSAPRQEFRAPAPRTAPAPAPRSAPAPDGLHLR